LVSRRSVLSEGITAIGCHVSQNEESWSSKFLINGLCWNGSGARSLESGASQEYGFAPEETDPYRVFPARLRILPARRS
jgi:hypothetical protein